MLTRGLSLDAETATNLVAIVASMAHFLSAAQLLVNLQLFAPNAALDWESVRARHLIAKTPAARLNSFGPKLVGALCLAKMLGSVGIAGAVITGALLLPWTALVVGTTLLMAVRAPELLVAADHISNIVVVAILLGLLGSADAMTTALGFIGLQACVVYVTAGVAKLRNPHWRNGAYIAGMVSTRTFGNRWIARTVLGLPAGSFVAAWLVILLETLFPLVLVLPTDLAIAGLIAMTCFHATAAAIMGFNLFFFAFPATFPAVLFLNLQLRLWLA